MLMTEFSRSDFLRVATFLAGGTLVACSPKAQKVVDVLTPIPATLPANTEGIATPKTPVEGSYVEKLKSESTIEHVETEHNGAPVNVNVYSHESIKTYQFVEMNKVLLDQEFKNDSGEDYKKATAHLVLQALAQAWKSDSNAGTFAQVIKDFMAGNRGVEETAVPLFADDLETEGYNPSMREFYPIDPETKQPNEVNIVFMNVPLKDFPGASLEIRGVTGTMAIGRAIDKDGNLYIFVNHFPAAAASGGYANIGKYSRNMITESLESLNWKDGTTDQDTIAAILSNDSRLNRIMTRGTDYLFNTDPDYTNYK